MAPCSVLQLTCLAIVIPVALAAYLRDWVGVGVLGANLVTSLVVHRVHRTERRDASDAADLVAIAAWVVYNAFLLARVSTQPLTGVRLVLVAASLGLAAAGLGLDAWRYRYAWRCRERNAVHGAMHVTMSLGTVALLVASVLPTPARLYVVDGF